MITSSVYRDNLVGLDRPIVRKNGKCYYSVIVNLDKSSKLPRKFFMYCYTQHLPNICWFLGGLFLHVILLLIPRNNYLY